MYGGGGGDCPPKILGLPPHNENYAASPAYECIPLVLIIFLDYNNDTQKIITNRQTKKKV